MGTWTFVVTAITVSMTTLFFDADVTFSHDLIFPAEKLKTLFPQAESFEQKNLYVSDVQKADLEKAQLGSSIGAHYSIPFLVKEEEGKKINK